MGSPIVPSSLRRPQTAALAAALALVVPAACTSDSPTGDSTTLVPTTLVPTTAITTTLVPTTAITTTLVPTTAITTTTVPGPTSPAGELTPATDALAELAALAILAEPYAGRADELAHAMADELLAAHGECDVAPTAMVSTVGESPAVATIDITFGCDDSVGGVVYTVTLDDPDGLGFVLFDAVRQSRCLRGVAGDLCV